MMIFVDAKRNGYYIMEESPLLAHRVHFILESDGCLLYGLYH